jgi:hypothetical protein
VETVPNRPPITVNKPFIPQAQAIEPFGCCSKDKIPSGKGIPRKKLTGDMNKIVAVMRVKRESARNVSWTMG